MSQATKPKVLQTGEDVSRLTTRQIKNICTRHGWHCQVDKEPNVPNEQANNHRYRKNNSVKVARNGNWLPLGWKWDIEVLDEEQIVKLLKALEQDSKSESTSSCSTTGTHA